MEESRYSQYRIPVHFQWVRKHLVLPKIGTRHDQGGIDRSVV